jgi:hypothetical protein
MKNNNEQANHYVNETLVCKDWWCPEEKRRWEEVVSRLANVVNRDKYELKEKNKSIGSANKSIKFPVCGAWGLRYE